MDWLVTWNHVMGMKITAVAKIVVSFCFYFLFFIFFYFLFLFLGFITKGTLTKPMVDFFFSLSTIG